MGAHEFYLETINKVIDIDHAYGGQCWDLFAYYCQKMGTSVINCTSSGYVKDLWLQRKTNGVLNDYEVISPNNIQDGDWVIFRETKQTPYSHVAMFRKDNGNGTGIFLGQNQGGNGAVSQVNLNYGTNWIYGIFRHKKWNKISINVKSSGYVKVIVDVLNVRSEPNTRSSIEATYTKGQKLYYDSIVAVNKYYWAHYKSYGGSDRYIALGVVDKELYVEYIGG